MPGKKKGGGGAAKGGAKGGKKGDPKAKEKKQKLLEERTFGLKNKNKSKKTQRMIDQMEKSLVGTKDNKSKKKEKDARKQEDLELKMLFKEAKKKDAGQQQQQQQEETEPEVREDDLPLEERIELQVRGRRALGWGAGAVATDARPTRPPAPRSGNGCPRLASPR